MPDVVIIETGDGSHSLLNKALDETYHSRHGALQESLHVFITYGLEFQVSKSGMKQVRILEVGFGTGLNAFLSWQYAGQAGIEILYESLEPFPLDELVWTKLNYGSSDQERFNLLHRTDWNQQEQLSPEFRLLKRSEKIQSIRLTSASYDLIYFDAFAPNKQPEMWELPVLEAVVEAMASGSTFVTYCAKGQLKRDLKSLGLTVETLPGPPGKKEMVRALKP